jgi:hypothetical protein
MGCLKEESMGGKISGEMHGVEHCRIINIICEITRRQTLFIEHDIKKI